MASSMTRRIAKALWFLLALLFLIEAWLWDLVQPFIARFVRLIPYEAFKAALARAISKLPAGIVIFVFILPDALSYPVQFFALWMVAQGAAISGTALFVIAKAFGLVGTLILFEVCQEKLEELAWYRWVAAQFSRARAWAREQVEPARVILHGVRTRIVAEMAHRTGRGGLLAYARRLRAGVSRKMHKGP
jgi:hypothetical protein